MSTTSEKMVLSWTPARRKNQSEVMRRVNKIKWASYDSNPQEKNRLMREKSQGFANGHPLSLWRCDIAVNLSDGELADKLGVSEQTVSNWQNGRSVPHKATARKLEVIASSYPVTLDMKWANK